MIIPPSIQPKRHAGYCYKCNGVEQVLHIGRKSYGVCHTDKVCWLIPWDCGHITPTDEVSLRNRVLLQDYKKQSMGKIS